MFEPAFDNDMSCGKDPVFPLEKTCRQDSKAGVDFGNVQAALFLRPF